MGYTGDVSPGSAPAVRELRGLTVTKVSVGPYDNNAYLLRCAADGTQVLIDAANDAATLVKLVGDGGLSAVVTTHQHPDHHFALAEVVAATGARSFAGADDAEGIPVVTDPVRDGDTIPVGDCTLEVIHVVGHTPGSIVLLYREPDGIAHLFTGDCLFPGGVGKTVGEENFQSLIGDVEAKLFGRLPDDTWFYPGHGKDSTLGAERPHLPEWHARGW
ncbi:MBL fold metallo-hydrolase [Actinoplanes sp. NPDC051859]|uniref:MBL fold metallo-hydrolase n=1 Tax=Actinoplanes sp. NPDC051859 TaxID=3363909 RepID=UPI0037A263E5